MAGCAACCFETGANNMQSFSFMLPLLPLPYYVAWVGIAVSLFPSVVGFSYIHMDGWTSIAVGCSKRSCIVFYYCQLLTTPSQQMTLENLQQTSAPNSIIPFPQLLNTASSEHDEIGIIFQTLDSSRLI